MKSITVEQLLNIKSELLLDEHEACFDRNYCNDMQWDDENANVTRSDAYAKTENWLATASYEDIIKVYGDKYEYILESDNK